MLAIIDYGVGNLTSIQKMLYKIGYHDVIITSDSKEIEAADKLILPGVGHFDYGMNQLRTTGLISCLNEQVSEKKGPILGICLGAQLMTKRSDEGQESGLGWIDGETLAFDRSRLSKELRVPHMGWADTVPQKESKLFRGLLEEQRFYFVHSFHMTLANHGDALVAAKHGYEFCAGFEHENIVGVQFHPEKSHRFGMQLLQNFVELYP